MICNPPSVLAIMLIFFTFSAFSQKDSPRPHRGDFIFTSINNVPQSIEVDIIKFPPCLINSFDLGNLTSNTKLIKQRTSSQHINCKTSITNG